MKLVVMKHESSIQPINIFVAQERYGAKYIGEFCVKTKDGGWSDFPIAIFYQPNPQTELGHTHYFGLFLNEQDQLIITRGDSAFDEPIAGLICDDGMVIYSRYRHDYVSSPDGKFFIDGGRDYTRFGGGHHRLVKLLIDKDKLVIDPASIDNAFKDEKTQRITTLTSSKDLK